MKKKQILNVKTFVKLNDQVKIITGNLKGTIGIIISLNKKTLLAQINSVGERERYFTKLEKQKQLEINKNIEVCNKKKLPRFIHISNLALYNKKL